jgi:hypothetical protein
MRPAKAFSREHGANIGDGIGGGGVDEEEGDIFRGEILRNSGEAGRVFFRHRARRARESDHEKFRRAKIGKAAGLAVDVGEGDVGDEAADSVIGGPEDFGAFAGRSLRCGGGGGRCRDGVRGSDGHRGFGSAKSAGKGADLLERDKACAAAVETVEPRGAAGFFTGQFSVVIAIEFRETRFEPSEVVRFGGQQRGGENSGAGDEGDTPELHERETKHGRRKGYDREQSATNAS